MLLRAQKKKSVFHTKFEKKMKLKSNKNCKETDFENRKLTWVR